VSETPETKEAMAWRLAWLHFVSSLSMADHMGDASNYARVFAEEMGLPMPPDDAELEEWSSWAVEQGLDDEDSGIYSDAFKAVAKARELGGSTAGPLSPEGKAESPSVSALLTLQEGLKEMEAKCRRRAAFSYNVADRIRNPVADRTEADVLRQGADVALSCADELSALLSSLLGQETKDDQARVDAMGDGNHSPTAASNEVK
jgi:hypothetical protein